jgi:hypothetical protein
MFVVPVVQAVLLPILPDPVPIYARLLLQNSFLLPRWHFVAALPIVAVLLTAAAFTSPTRAHR